jgi:adenine-specific DNA glycosylase
LLLVAVIFQHNAQINGEYYHTCYFQEYPTVQKLANAEFDDLFSSYRISHPNKTKHLIEWPHAGRKISTGSGASNAKAFHDKRGVG